MLTADMVERLCTLKQELLDNFRNILQNIDQIQSDQGVREEKSWLFLMLVELVR